MMAVPCWSSWNTGILQRFAQFAFDIEALRRFDVFEVDTAESRFQRSDDVYQFLRVFFIDFDIEYVNAGEFFEQYTFAFHYRFTGQCADVAQTQHCCTVGITATKLPLAVYL